MSCSSRCGCGANPNSLSIRENRLREDGRGIVSATMNRAFLPLSVLTLFVASSLPVEAQSGSKKQTLWSGIASATVPNSVSMTEYDGAYYFSPKSGATMAGASFEWIDRSGKKTIQSQAADTKTYMKANGYKLLAGTEKFLSSNRVWTADYETTEGGGHKEVRLSYARQAF